MRDSELLIKARDLISRKGHWCKGRLRDVVPIWHCSPGHTSAEWGFSYCAIGALLQAAHGGNSSWLLDIPGAWDDQTSLLLSRLSAAMPTRFLRVENFNDAFETTQADVIDLYDKAIAAAQDVEMFQELYAHKPPVLIAEAVEEEEDECVTQSC